MEYPKPFVAMFAPMLDTVIPALVFAPIDLKADTTYAFYSAAFRNDRVDLVCELERGRPAIMLRLHGSEHWFHLSEALRALTGKTQNPLDVQALTRSFLEEYPRLIEALDTDAFNRAYLDSFSARLGGYRPW